MAIAKNPRRNIPEAANRKAEAFISGPEPTDKHNRKPTMIRIPPDIFKRIDHGAKRLGISRSAFIVLSAAEKLERMEQ